MWQALRLVLFLFKWLKLCTSIKMANSLKAGFKNMFVTGEEIHNYNTRNNFFFVSPLVGQMYENSHLDFKVLNFNSINDEIKNSLNLKEFISKLKSTFLD